ncbi:MAG: response regulator [Gammaproteobacteria bacterium]|nr:response regulator [Gammaproteobacteria bacterium]
MKLLQIGKQNSERLIRLINDILDVEKIESGKMEFKFEPLHLDLIVREAMLANESFSKKFNINLKLIQKTVTTVNVDRDRLLQVLVNLISNGIKFSTPGKEVTICVEKKENNAIVSVSNHGAGVPETFRPRIFEKFAQANPTTSRSQSGTGLGLSISKEIIEKLGGTIDFESEIDKETRFWIELPIYDKSFVTKKSFEKIKSILICDNDKAALNYLKTVLEEQDFNVMTAQTATEARNIIDEQHVDALLLDLTLPNQDGISLIKDLRKRFSITDLPITVITVEPDGAKKMNGNAISVLDWIEKPIELGRLLAAIKLMKVQIEIKTPKILHIEDDQDLIQIIAKLLQTEASVLGVTTLAQAREELQSSHFDLVILDLMLPDGSGIEMLPIISKKQIPVIVFSAYDLPPDYNQFVVKTLLKSKASPHELLKNIIASLTHNKMPIKEI